jgi:hypothetical protein
VVAVIPEFDDYLKPQEALERFASISQIEFVAVDDGKHLWVGETQTKRVLNEIVRAVNPSAYPVPETMLL